MTTNISGYGLRIQLVATLTFPTGFVITQFADDADPFEVTTLQVGDAAMGLNGDLITWTKANPIKVAISVVPNSNDDLNLQILLNANRASRGKLVIPDLITMTVQYPRVGVFAGNSFNTYTQGKIIDGTPGNSVASTGRFKSKTYSFMFEGENFA